jgi:hypothetical protein
VVDVPPVTVFPPAAREPPVLAESPPPALPAVPGGDPWFEDELHARECRDNATTARIEERFMATFLLRAAQNW